MTIDVKEIAANLRGLTDLHDWAYRVAAEAADALEAQARELDALRADAARLDFIAKNARCDPKMDGNHVWWPTTFNNSLKGDTLRHAVDAAMAAQPAPRPEAGG